jgi:putative ABC transport system permease protein
MQGQVYGRVADILSWAISLVALLGAAFAVLNTMVMAVNERRGEIAILGAIGWGRGRIVGLILAEGVLLALAGGAAGVALGIAAAEGVAAAPSVAGFVAPAIGWGLAAQAMLVALALGLAGSLWPAPSPPARCFCGAGRSCGACRQPRWRSTCRTTSPSWPPLSP